MPSSTRREFIAAAAAASAGAAFGGAARRPPAAPTPNYWCTWATQARTLAAYRASGEIKFPGDQGLEPRFAERLRSIKEWKKQKRGG